MTEAGRTRLVRWGGAVGLAIIALPFGFGLTGVWDYWQFRDRTMGFVIAALLIGALAGAVARRWKAFGIALFVGLICADGYLWPHVLGML